MNRRVIRIGLFEMNYDQGLLFLLLFSFHSEMKKDRLHACLPFEQAGSHEAEEGRLQESSEVRMNGKAASSPVPVTKNLEIGV